MNEELITKKELLEKYGISYGALYRWKRKKLIPDEWFIHKSTFTGQETFMPKKKIIERVEMIMKLKDSISLDEIAESFIPSFSKTELEHDDIINNNISDDNTLNEYLKVANRTLPLNYNELIELFSYKKLECHYFEAVKCISDNLDSLNNSSVLFIIQNRNNFYSFIDNSGGEYIKFSTSDETKINRYHISDWIAEIENIIKRES